MIQFLLVAYILTRTNVKTIEHYNLVSHVIREAWLKSDA